VGGIHVWESTGGPNCGLTGTLKQIIYGLWIKTGMVVQTDYIGFSLFSKLFWKCGPLIRNTLVPFIEFNQIRQSPARSVKIFCLQIDPIEFVAGSSDT
jgi:hypothetical protein